MSLIKQGSASAGTIFRGWGYQDFDAGVIDSTEVILTANQNGDNAQFFTDKIAGNTAVVVSKDNPGTFVYNGAVKLFSKAIKATQQNGVTVTLNGVPNPVWGAVRIYYFYMYDVIPTNYNEPPQSVSSTLLSSIDDVFVTDEEMESALTQYRKSTEEDELLEQYVEKDSDTQLQSLNITGRNIPLAFGEEVNFTHTNYGSEVDVISNTVKLTRGSSNPIYNIVYEGGYQYFVSPQNTEWNMGGWGDFSDITTRNYYNFQESFGGGNIGNMIIGAELIMRIISEDRYFKIQFNSWSSNAQGGGFSYTRQEIFPPRTSFITRDGKELKGIDELKFNINGLTFDKNTGALSITDKTSLGLAFQDDTGHLTNTAWLAEYANSADFCNTANVAETAQYATYDSDGNEISIFYIPTYMIGAANGICPLVDGKVSSSYLPPLGTSKNSVITNTVASVTINGATTDIYQLTAQASDIVFNNPSGTPYHGKTLQIIIQDNGTPRAISWGLNFRFSVENPTVATTEVGKKKTIAFQWDSSASYWEILGTSNIDV